jgi:hypothetical protein
MLRLSSYLALQPSVCILIAFYKMFVWDGLCFSYCILHRWDLDFRDTGLRDVGFGH